MKRFYTYLILSIVALLIGCNPYKQDDYRQYYVVESYLIANAPLPEVRVSTTLPIDEFYSFEKAAIGNANVSVQLLAADGSVQFTYEYRPVSAGIYGPVNLVEVKPARYYRLNITLQNGDTVQSETFVPGKLSVIGQVPDSIVYQAPERLEFNTTSSFYPGRQTYFIFSLKVKGTPSADQLTPFYADVFDEAEQDISDFYLNSSPIINEKTYTKNENGTITVFLPWNGVAFYGQNKIIISAIDDNFYDFIRSQSAQVGGGGSLPPGQIQNIIYHVKGGIGIFGSLATDTVKVFIKRN